MAVMAQWFSATYRLPPNHPLFVEETLTYWKEQFYIDCLRRREVLWNEAQSLKATSLTGKAQQERQTQISGKMSDIDDINNLLGEPRRQDSPSPGMPEFVRQAAAERRGLRG